MPPLRTRPDELRTNLRLAFDMFDESKTGIVATSHVENILAAVGIKVLPNEARDPILQLLANAESGASIRMAHSASR